MKKILLIFVFLFALSPTFSQETQNNNTTICWDISSSMADRDLEKDLSVLEKVFQRGKNQEVQLLLFGINVEEKNYSIKEGDWTSLKNDLQNVAYDGGTVYANLKGKIKNPNVYVFTDGQKTLSKDLLALNGKSFLVNSSPSRNAKFLERTALLNKSRLMDFAAMLPENVKALQQKTANEVPQQRPQIKGTVYIDNKPASSAKVTIKGISDSFLTDASGAFSIPAQVGDTLVVTSRKSKTIKMLPVESMTHLNVFMASNIVALDEVVVIEQQLEEEAKVMTGYRLQNQKEIGYTVSTIDAEDISEVTLTAGDAINTKIPGVEIKGQNPLSRENGGIGNTRIRGNASINMNVDALVVIDGVPMQRSDTSGSNYAKTSFNMDYVDPSNIASITVLKGLAATNAWGSEGRGGVILITTKTAQSGGGKGGKPVDQALLKNNVYNESQGELASSTSPTLNALNGSKSLQDAYDTYMALRNLNQTNIKFFLDAFSYFKDKDSQIAGKVISNLLEWNTDDIDVLRVVSKAFSTIGDYENAVHVNDEIIALSPNDVNAYFNRALAKKGQEKYQECLNELIALDKGNTYFSVNASGIKKTLNREIKNLIFEHKSELNVTSIDSKYLNNLKYKVRLVFEWNTPAEEFELQFVNPQKRFFNWVHTNSEIKQRIEDELKNNYRIEEYEFYGDVAGEWVINAKYLGETKIGDEAPLVLKCTIFTNFGYPEQSKEDVLVHFSQANEKKNLKKLFVN
ncbi:TonB-dependent receptor plug domain-containing protein [Maribacter sp. 2308TA10-17]|uniref:TonB-dependent receptor plug domain-containing protein n=1 Tax=Maribacter sp. 2308TA10-17 TaxID=3386276 RepID=UPI0039BC55A4